MGEFKDLLDQLPRHSLLAAGFITFLSGAPEDSRRDTLKQWMQLVNVPDFDLRRFVHITLYRVNCKKKVSNFSHSGSSPQKQNNYSGKLRDCLLTTCHWEMPLLFYKYITFYTLVEKQICHPYFRLRCGHCWLIHQLEQILG